MKRDILKRAIIKTPHTFYIRGKSMLPFYPNGKKVIVIPAKKYKIGDIIAYQKNKQLIIHRIIKKEKNYVLTKGDSNLFIDKRIKKEKIIGKIKVSQKYKVSNYIVGKFSLLIGESYILYKKIFPITS